MNFEIKKPWWAYFRRITTSGNYIDVIDGLRFVAIVWTLFFHLDGFLILKASDQFTQDPSKSFVHTICAAGHYGVMLFFVISGFVLALPFAKNSFQLGEPVSLKSYYLRRVTRLEPPYMLSFLMIYVLQIIVLGKQIAVQRIPDLFAGLTYTSFIFCPNLNPINCVSWSLEVEIQFYLMVPLLIKVFDLPVISRRLLIIAMMVLMASLPDFGPIYGKSLLAFLPFFLGGFLVADLYLHNQLRSGSLWADGLMVITAWFFYQMVYTSPYFAILCPFFLTTFVIAAFRGRWTTRILTNPVVTTIGGMCYSIYLLHFVVISGLNRHLHIAGSDWSYPVYFLAQFFLIALPLLALCSIYYLLIEHPCMEKNWPTRLWFWIKQKIINT